MAESQNSFYSSVVDELVSQFQSYSKSRSRFLEQLNLSKSCRDPLAEFSEVLVGKLLNATLADSRVQKGYDLVKPNQRLVQVKYLCNPSGNWINEHPIKFPDSVDEYALVIFVSLQLESVLVFQRETLGVNQSQFMPNVKILSVIIPPLRVDIVCILPLHDCTYIVGL